MTGLPLDLKKTCKTYSAMKSQNKKTALQRYFQANVFQIRFYIQTFQLICHFKMNRKKPVSNKFPNSEEHLKIGIYINHCVAKLLWPDAWLLMVMQTLGKQLKMCINPKIYRGQSLLCTLLCSCICILQTEIEEDRLWVPLPSRVALNKTLNYIVSLLETLCLFVWRVLSACLTAMKWDS